jgi:hypothetical protein
MIAIALSTTICFTAFSALRTASQSVTICQRMSFENQLLRVGVLSALDDVDFWSSYDSIETTAKRRLRSAGPGNGSNPFKPLTFDPAFDQSNTKTRFRLIAAAARSGDGRFGDDALLQKVGHSEKELAWLPKTFQDISGTIGNYGLIDYLPANSVFSFNDQNGKKPSGFSQPGNGMYVAPSYNEGYGVWGLGHLTHHTIFGITYPSNDEGILQTCNQSGFTDYASGTRTKEFHTRGPVISNMLAVKPANWPTCDFRTRRYVGDMSSCCLVDVLVTSPISGQTIKMQFMTLGTTLRGARQQRGLDTYVTR